VISQTEHTGTVMNHQIKTCCGKKPGILRLMQLRVKFGNIQPSDEPVMGPLCASFSPTFPIFDGGTLSYSILLVNGGKIFPALKFLLTYSY
jgi:hypothetical protein